ncbi:MAG: CHAD domain-containing protein [Methanoregula sp.]|nr:CHAD domain-containing protein [Methanoregula sp.]
MASCKHLIIGEKTPLAPVTATCLFGKKRLLPLLEAFAKEIDGVKAAEDIEYIHRMRVASRRLRAALPLFCSCFAKKPYAKWSEELRTITRALGDARDCDVQIAYLQKYQKRAEKSWKSKKPANGEESPTSPAVRYLLLDLQKRRGLLQKEVLSALKNLEKSRAIDEMRIAFTEPVLPVRSGMRRAFSYGIAPVAAIRIEQRLLTLLAFEPWVSHPEAVAEHHATRIAAKKLRYTLEVYAPVYRLNLQKPISRVKAVQEILGDLHDCDVWIDTIIRLLLHERSRLRSENEAKRPDTCTLSSLKIFLAEREKERMALYRHFVRYWATLKRTLIWHTLRSTLDTGRKIRFRPREQVPEAELRAIVEQVSAEYPKGQNHSLLVTRLSLMLFDSLKPAHNLTSRDRILLECAGMLHDIGWKFGQKNHNKRSASMIFADERLPLDITERGMVALAALAHRGQVTVETHPFFSLLCTEEQENVLLLSGILRIADGLDYLHLGTAQEIHCVIGKEILCDVTGSADLSVEKDRARGKADLFQRTFGKTLVIP